MHEQPPRPQLQVTPAAGRRVPLVVASPHSGDHYEAAFLASVRLAPRLLRRSEDSFVHELFAAAPRLGAPLLRALFPRSFVDVNREPFELDPVMFDQPLPSYVNSQSPRVAMGLGTLARVAGANQEIYQQPLPVAEAFRRLEACYFPYHRALADLVDETLARFGFCLLLDCHSMPSSSAGTARDGAPSDIVLGDCHGASCGRDLVDLAASTLRRLGYRVTLNLPYAGGFVTRHYGRPERGCHALQVEINRRLYMDEETLDKGPGFDRLAADMALLLEVLAQAQPEITLRAAE